MTREPKVAVPLRILSLGAGVQSSTLALMAAIGAIPPIDGAIFADTQAEPSSVRDEGSATRRPACGGGGKLPARRLAGGALEGGKQ